MKHWLLISTVLLCFVFTMNGKDMMQTATDRNGKSYFYFANDPFNARIYRLDNGLTLFLSRNPAKPRTAVMTIVRAGSTDDPENSTGLAHYFEHMMFKGTPRLGSLDWKKEEPLLTKIEDLFEKRRKIADSAEKDKIYQEIDRLSNEAAKYASAGEFSKLVSTIGGANLNAGTSLDFTVYYADIPGNELKKYLILDAERFSTPILRLFHTELETVYEEFNISQDKDQMASYAALNRELFPLHPNGRPIIGLPEHLKNPSMRDINAFFRKFYVPSNMALAIVGDLDYEQAYEDANQTFGRMSAGTRPERNPPKEKPLEKSLVQQISGPEPEHILIGWRMERTPKNYLLLALLQKLLTDNGSGLLDQNVLRSQKVLGAAVYPRTGREYLTLMMNGTPRTGQSLDEVAKILTGELEKIEKGDYEDWRIQAVADNMRVELEEMRNGDPMDIAWEFAAGFINDEPYSDTLRMPDEIEKLTKKDVSEFLRKYFRHSVRINKITGKPEGRVKVAKPKITPVELNSSKTSAYAQDFLKLPAPAPIRPEYVDPAKDIETKVLANGITIKKIKRSLAKQLFQVQRAVNVGKYDDIRLALALDYLDFVGTDRYDPGTLRQEFYKLGLRFSFSSDRYFSFAELSGPAARFEKGMELLEHFILHAKSDRNTWQRYVDGILKVYADEKLKPQAAFLRAVSYAWYGKENPQTFLPSEKMLQETNPEELLSYIRTLFTAYPGYLVYDGPADMKTLEKTALAMQRSKMEKLPGHRIFHPKAVEKPNVYLVQFDTVQLRIGFTSRAGKFELSKLADGAVFNEYFCQGLDSIVFQVIREARGLAYAAGGSYNMPMQKNRFDLIYMVVGTQPDKMTEAVGEMNRILKKMPLSEPKFNSSREAVAKQIATTRVYGLDVFQYEQKMIRMGVKTDWRKKEYAQVSKMTLNELNAFFNENLAGLRYDLLLVGKTDSLDRKKLSEYGTVIELNLNEIYGY